MNFIKLKGYITYNIGRGYYWLRIGNILITYMHRKKVDNEAQ